MNLTAWQQYIDSIHTKSMDLGIERVREVAASNLQVNHFDCPVVIVGGTNGKGTTVATLEAIYQEAGYKVAAFTSPCLFSLNEQIRVNGESASDEQLCAAFARIEESRAAISLTPFEFHTLAALLIFKQAQPDIMILEVGLGGRLDAVNILDADVAIVTSIALDHTEYLGNTREAIAHEKAGIFRQGKPAICGDDDPPRTLRQDAEDKGVIWYALGEAFRYQQESNQSTFTFIYQTKTWPQLPHSDFVLSNLACALMAIELLSDRLPVALDVIRAGLSHIQLRGRFEQLPGKVLTILDVAHNPAAATMLAQKLMQQPCAGKTLAVFSMLHDKDIISCLQAVSDQIDSWYVSVLTTKRAASREQLQQAFMQANIDGANYFDSIDEAYQQALKAAQPGDRIIVFGSFYTVAAILAAL